MKRVWAWRTSNTANFGDELGPAILARLGLELERVDDIAEADIIAGGSVLEYAAEHARPGAIIWGCGLALGEPVDVRHLDVRVVRGELTRRAIGQDVPLGDPGALVPAFWRRPAARHGIGVVRHYIDERDYGWADLVIDTLGPVDEVIEAIGSCERIASSSLHGLIVAHAWNIPAMRIHHPGVANGEFKWLDWFSGARAAPALYEAIPCN